MHGVTRRVETCRKSRSESTNDLRFREAINEGGYHDHEV